MSQQRMIDLYHPEVKFAIESVRLASKMVKQIQAEMVSPALTKDDRSPVTVADFASQALVGCLLAANFPDAVLVAEECSADLRSSGNQLTLEQVTSYVSRFISQATIASVCEWIDMGEGDPGTRFWVLDPIDGTKGFLRGDQYVIALALVENAQVKIGVLGCPNLLNACEPDYNGPGSLVVAMRGQGAWVTTLDKESPYKSLSVSPCKESTKARLLRSYEALHTNAGQIDWLAKELRTQVIPVRMDSQAKYAVLSAGAGDLMVRTISAEQPDYREKIWDQAAGSIVVEEAGGMITDLEGKPLDFSTGRRLTRNRGVLASNTALHQAALLALKSVQN